MYQHSHFTFESLQGVIDSVNRPHIVVQTPRGFVNTSDSWDAFNGVEPQRGQTVEVLMLGSRPLSVRPDYARNPVSDPS